MRTHTYTVAYTRPACPQHMRTFSHRRHVPKRSEQTYNARNPCLCPQSMAWRCARRRRHPHTHEQTHTPATIHRIVRFRPHAQVPYPTRRVTSHNGRLLMVPPGAGVIAANPWGRRHRRHAQLQAVFVTTACLKKHPCATRKLLRCRRGRGGLSSRSTNAHACPGCVAHSGGLARPGARPPCRLGPATRHEQKSAELAAACHQRRGAAERRRRQRPADQQHRSRSHVLGPKI